jgi:hypothetical protein
MLPLACSLGRGGGTLGLVPQSPTARRLTLWNTFKTNINLMAFFRHISMCLKAKPNMHRKNVRTLAAVDQPKQQQDPAAAKSSHLRSLPTPPPPT